MWLSRSQYRSLCRQIARAERRASLAEEAACLERIENRRAERHWANALLRAKQAFPMVEKPAVPSAPSAHTRPSTPWDEGELEALQAKAAELGIDPAEAINVLRRDYAVE